MFARNRNLFIGIAVAVIVVLLIIFTGGDRDEREEVNLDGASKVAENEVASEEEVAPVEIPMPSTEEWGSYDLDGKISFDVPNGYIVSRPSIGECSIASITTDLNGRSIGVAFVYEQGCDLPETITENYEMREVVNGFVFQTLYTEASVVEVFKQIVASAGGEAEMEEEMPEESEEEMAEEEGEIETGPEEGGEEA